MGKPQTANAVAVCREHEAKGTYYIKITRRDKNDDVRHDSSINILRNVAF